MRGEQESFLITPRDEDYSQWYQDVISAAQMVRSPEAVHHGGRSLSSLMRYL